jgi:type III secretion protein J
MFQKKSFFALCALLFLASCATNQSIVTNIDERDANEIVVFLASKGIGAQKILVPQGAGGGGPQIDMFNISVARDQSTVAMALLTRQGLPRRQGTTLLSLFAKGGLMSSGREETIRYQAGLAEELRNTIRKMDGVLDADVQISFPITETAPMPGTPKPTITAAVYVKHQGIMDDPNAHMEIKIKRLMAGSINGLSFDDVSVISDRSRIADISLQPEVEAIGPKSLQQTYVTIWGLVLTKSSLFRFRVIFFAFILLLILFAAATGWLIYKFYPHMRKKEIEQSENLPPGPNI